MTVVIRPAGDADLDRITEIYAHHVIHGVATFDEVPLTVDQWRQRHTDLATRGLPFLVAEVERTVAGYAYASQWRPKPAYRYTVEDTIYLDPAWTGRGLGRQLLDAVLTGCAEAGARQVIAVISDSGDDASVALHRKFGFTETGRLTAVGHKHGKWLDTILMQRPLPPTP